MARVDCNDKGWGGSAHPCPKATAVSRLTVGPEAWSFDGTY